MKYPLIVLAVFFLVAAACNKDKFTSVPQVKIKSISPETVYGGDIIQLKGSFTDEEGDVDSVFIVYKWYNGNTGFKALDTLRYSFDATSVPANTRNGDITIGFTYHITNPPYLPGVSQDTTATLGIILLDKKKNRSDYKESDKFRLMKP